MNHSKTHNKVRTRRMGFALILALLLTICLPTAAFAGTSTTPNASQVNTIISKVSAYEIAQLKAQSTGATYGNEWALMALARAGTLTSALKQQYLTNLTKYLKNNKNSLGATVTDYDRVILALTAMGIDATNLNGIDLTAPLANLDDVTAPGVSGSIYALLALDSHPYNVPTLKAGVTGPQTTRKALVGAILDAQLTGGGWNWGWGATAPDPDLTSMAIQALAPYYGKGNTKVDAAVDAGLNALSSIQNSTGGLLSEWSPNPSSESSAQALVALSALGISIKDPRFVKTGATLYDSLTSFLVSAGTGKQAFLNNIGDKAPDGMATEQGLYALVAYERSLTGAARLYGMSNVTLQPYPAPVPTPKPKNPKPKTTPASHKTSVTTVTPPPAPASTTPQETTATPVTTPVPATGDTTIVPQLIVVTFLLMGSVAIITVLRTRSEQSL